MHLFFEKEKRDNLLSRMDARVKLGFALCLLLMVLSSKGFLFPLIISAVSLGLCIWMRIPLRTFLLRFSEPLFITTVVIGLKLFFGGKEPLFSCTLAGMTITGYVDGLREGLLIGSRIIGTVSVVGVLGLTTPFTEIMAGLSWFRVPRGFIEISLFAYRYIFVLLEEAMVIYNAQKNRLGYVSFRKGLSSFGTLAGSLVIKAFDHSHNTTVAMVQRGYDGNIPLMKHRSFRRSEVAVSALLIIALGVIWKA
ncbi:MAG: cobalt ECF transporter T component CbiQ [Thermodesulfovibrionales bacterium]|jgi:cobalt/nickel transport system permease protein